MYAPAAGCCVTPNTGMTLIDSKSKIKDQRSKIKDQGSKISHTTNHLGAKKHGNFNLRLLRWGHVLNGLGTLKFHAHREVQTE